MEKLDEIEKDGGCSYKKKSYINKIIILLLLKTKKPY